MSDSFPRCTKAERRSTDYLARSGLLLLSRLLGFRLCGFGLRSCRLRLRRLGSRLLKCALERARQPGDNKQHNDGRCDSNRDSSPIVVGGVSHDLPSLRFGAGFRELAS